MSLFDGIKQTQVYGSGNYISAGTYELEVHEVSTFESSQHPGRFYFCVESDVLASTSENHKVGERITWLVNMQQPSSLSNCLGFALALNADATASDIDEATMESICGFEQPARGLRVKAFANNVKTRTGGDFTKVSWETLPVA